MIIIIIVSYYYYKLSFYFQIMFDHKKIFVATRENIKLTQLFYDSTFTDTHLHMIFTVVELFFARPYLLL